MVQKKRRKHNAKTARRRETKRERRISLEKAEKRKILYRRLYHGKRIQRIRKTPERTQQKL